LDVDWGTTFFILNDDKNSSVTTSFASNQKSHRIKFLLEELPTIEHVKLQRDLYDGWNCPSCKNEKETFSHIWLCHQHRHIMNTIVFNQKKELICLIRHFGNISGFSSRDLLHDDLWTISFQPN
jgi:hypothetical protein